MGDMDNITMDMHTEGDWLSENTDEEWEIKIKNPYPYSICRVYNGSRRPENKANALLLLNAPKILAENKDLKAKCAGIENIDELLKAKSERDKLLVALRRIYNDDHHATNAYSALDIICCIAEDAIESIGEPLQERKGGK